MPTAAEIEQDIHQLEHLDVERTDGVDRPATRRKFLLSKSEDQDELQINAEKLAADANQLVQIGTMVLETLCNIPLMLTDQDAQVLNAFAQALGAPSCFTVGPNPPDNAGSGSAMPSTGGNMAMQASEKSEEFEETVEEETVEEETVEEEATEKAAYPTTNGKKKPKVVDQSNQPGTKGPPSAAKGAMPKKKMRAVKAEEEDDETTVEETDSNYISQEDLETRVDAAVEQALEKHLSPILTKMEEFFTGQVAKSEGKRPVSKQANGQDTVTKSAPRNVGEGVFTNIIF